MAWVFCDQRGTRMPGVFLRVCEAKDSLERRVSWTSSTSLSDRTKSLIAAFWIRAPIQTALRLFYPKLPFQASRPTGAGLPAGCVEAEPTRSLSSSSLPRLSSSALWLAYGSHFYLSTTPGCCSLLCSSERNPRIPRRAISEAAREAASCLQGAPGPVTSA